LEVSNDGYPRETHKANQAGSGLSGLAERVAKWGGHLEASPHLMAGIPGFRLLVDIPIKEDVSMEVR
jgi:glucose-6-phosphate-specific signal transduction histidine kinase